MIYTIQSKRESWKDCSRKKIHFTLFEANFRLKIILQRFFRDSYLTQKGATLKKPLSYKSYNWVVFCLAGCLSLWNLHRLHCYFNQDLEKSEHLYTNGDRSYLIQSQKTYLNWNFSFLKLIWHSKIIDFSDTKTADNKVYLYFQLQQQLEHLKKFFTLEISRVDEYSKHLEFSSDAKTTFLSKPPKKSFFKPMFN